MVLDVLTGIVLNGLVVHGGVEVVEHGVEPHVAVADCLEAEQGVVDASQLAGGDEDEGVVVVGYVVDGEVVFGEGYHESARSLHEDGVVAAGKFTGGLLYLPEVDGAVVDARR